MTQENFLQRAAAGDEAAYWELAECARAAEQAGALPPPSAAMAIGVWLNLGALLTGSDSIENAHGREELGRAARGDLSAIKSATDMLFKSAAGVDVKAALSLVVAAECLLRLGTALGSACMGRQLAGALLWRGYLELAAGEAGHFALIDGLMILRDAATQGDIGAHNTLVEALNGNCAPAWGPIFAACPDLLALVAVEGAA